MVPKERPRPNYILPRTSADKCGNQALESSVVLSVKHATKRRKSNHIKSTAALTNPMNILMTNSSVQLRRPDRLGQRH